jgi:LysM repeat protein
MNIKYIAAAMIGPAAIAGVALSTGSAASAATVHPAAQAKYHRWVTVRTGDTLSGIAAAHHMSWEALYAAPPNRSRIQDPNVLTTGERVRIPADPALWASRYTPPQAPAQPAAAQAPAQGSTAQGSTAQGSTSQAPASSSSGSASSSTGGMSSFEQCVAWRESSNTPTDPDGLFGILPSTWASLGYSGTAGQASVAQQKAAFNQLYAQDGAQPWAPSDGC